MPKKYVRWLNKMKKEITCIVCPIGCRLTIEYSDTTINNIEGYQCKKGKVYGVEELLNPVRTLTTTIRVNNGIIPLVSVKSDKPIPKGKLFQIMDTIADVEVFAPINIGDVLVGNVIGLDANIVATKNIEIKK